MHHFSEPPLIDVLNEFGLITGKRADRPTIHRLGLWHRAVHLYLFNQDGQLLIQRRARTCDHYPGVWSISVTGHVDAGESSLTALKRETQEELGIQIQNMAFDFLFCYRQEANNDHYVDRQFIDVYVCQHDLQIWDIVYNSTEVDDVKFIDPKEFQHMVHYKHPELAPVYTQEFNDVAYFLNIR